MPLGLTSNVTGLTELRVKMLTLRKRTVGRIWRRGLQLATAPILKDAKARVPTRTRRLKRSLGRKVKVLKDGKGAYGLVGPRRGFAIEIDGKRVNPTRYAHLAERQTPFLGPALRANADKTFAILRRVAAEEIAKEAIK
jgi:hypothetical protein